MSKNQLSAKINMLEHSKAKVELYSLYLARYLNILSRVEFIDRIYIYDLMCGEGVYADGSKGSPIAALEKIKEHYFQNNRACPDMELWFNDNGKSEIDKNSKKIDRVRYYCSKLFKPNNVTVDYTDYDYCEIVPMLIDKINSLRNEKLLLFVDPYGYKNVEPKQLKSFLKNHKTELILFLPVSHLYRFARKALSEDFPGGTSLRIFLNELFNGLSIEYSTINEFIDLLKVSFKNYLAANNIFVDTFTIDRNGKNTYALFFFTPNAKGFETMLDAKWKMDEQHGKGFTLSSQQTLFSGVKFSNYPSLLEDFIRLSNGKTNKDIYLFGLEHSYLPKHTNQILRQWQQINPNFKVQLTDGTQARKGSFYISYNPSKVVKFIIER